MKLRSAVQVGSIALAVLVVLGIAGAQGAKTPRIGMLSIGAAPTPGQPNPLLDAFRGGFC